MQLKYVFVAMAIVFSLFACEDENVNTTTCGTPATVRDLTGLDGCGFVFELADGSRLEPQRLFFCGTPPLPKEVTEDPLYQFEFVDGKKVTIGYEACPDCASICMAGTMVKITCLSEDNSTPSGEE
jgi:hypothetical protein